MDCWQTTEAWLQKIKDLTPEINEYLNIFTPKRKLPVVWPWEIQEDGKMYYYCTVHKNFHLISGDKNVA